MSGAPRWTPLAIGYLVIAIVGLIGTWTLNILAAASGSDFVGEWFSNGFATQSLQVDLLVLALAAGVFVIPLFLALRERRLAATAHED